MTLATKLETRLRREIAEARELFAPVLEEPFYDAKSLSLNDTWDGPWWDEWGKHDDVLGCPMLYWRNGEWRNPYDSGEFDRPVLCSEVLEFLEKHTPDIAEYEAHTMALAGEFLMSDADARTMWLDHAAESWPWTENGFGSTSNTLSMLTRLANNLTDLVHLIRDGRDQFADYVITADATEWIAETLERREPGEGAKYRARPIWITANKVLIVDEQLEALYQALPPAVLHARALFRDFERIASGDEQRWLLERVAPAALAKANAEASDDARGKLAEALRRNVKKLRPCLRLDGTPPATEAEALDLLNTINEGFAIYVETRGETGATVARDVRAAATKHASADAEKRWTNWRAEPDEEPPWLVALAVVVWFHETKREVTQRPALVMQVHDDVTRIYSRASVFETRDGQRALTFDDSDPIVLVPTVGDDVAAALVERGAGRFGSLAAHRALRWEVFEGHARVLRHEPDARALRIEGGWSTFAHDVLGLTKKSDAERLKEIVHAQAAVVFRLPDGSTGNMLALHERPQQGRRRGSIEIVLGSMLLPFHGKTLANGADHRLVPMLRDLPPMVGRPNEHGALATLSMHVLRELRVKARELVTDGGVTIKPERWAQLAYQSRLSLALLPDVLERWLRDGDDAPALLASPWKGGYTLGNAHEPERDFLVAAGRDSLNASEGGKRSVQIRARKKRGRAGR